VSILPLKESAVCMVSFFQKFVRNCDVLPIYYNLFIVMFVRFFFKVRRLKCTLDVKKHLILMFCIRFIFGSYYIFLTVVLIMSLLYAARFFMSVWSGISGSFHSGSDFGMVSAAGAGSMTLDAAFLSHLCRWNTVVTAALSAV
jgi:hypothetical protein